LNPAGDMDVCLL